jgi:hypothetical protein
MKKIILILWLILAVRAFGQVNVKLQWDARPSGDTRISVRIYERSGSGPYSYTQVAEVAEPVMTATLSNVASGAHTYVARGWNGQQESPDSNAVTTTVLSAPGAPTNVTIIVVIQ